MSTARIDAEIGLKTGALQSGLGRARAMVEEFKRGAVNSLAGALSIGGLGALVAGSLKAASSMETLETSFGVLLGGADAAKAKLAELSTFAASTPFELPELAQAARSLIAFGVSAENVLPTLRSVGDIASGIGQPIGELAEIFGKAKVQGRLFAEDINQLTGRGVPIIQEFAAQFGVAESEVRGLVESGQIGFANLEQAFISLTSEGGKFFGMMDQQSQTTEGKISSMKDAFAELQRTIAKDWLGPLKEAVDWLTQGAVKAGELRRALSGESREDAQKTDAVTAQMEAERAARQEMANLEQRKAFRAKYGLAEDAEIEERIAKLRKFADDSRDARLGGTPTERAYKRAAAEEAAKPKAKPEKGPDKAAMAEVNKEFERRAKEEERIEKEKQRAAERQRQAKAKAEQELRAAREDEARQAEANKIANMDEPQRLDYLAKKRDMAWSDADVLERAGKPLEASKKRKEALELDDETSRLATSLDKAKPESQQRGAPSITADSLARIGAGGNVAIGAGTDPILSENRTQSGFLREIRDAVKKSAGGPALKLKP